jgi:hypothetical protein
MVGAFIVPPRCRDNRLPARERTQKHATNNNSSPGIAKCPDTTRAPLRRGHRRVPDAGPQLIRSQMLMRQMPLNLLMSFHRHRDSVRLGYRRGEDCTGIQLGARASA